MNAVLAELNKIPGVRGCMLVNRDGIIAASDFGYEVDEAGVGAMASGVLVALENALKRTRMGGLKRFLVLGSENRVLIVDAGPSFLLLVLQRDANIGLISVALDEARQKVAHATKM